MSKHEHDPADHDADDAKVEAEAEGGGGGGGEAAGTRPCAGCCAPCGRGLSWLCGAGGALCPARKADRVPCVLFALGVVSVLLALTAPLVLDALIQAGIRESVVVDSEAASAYATWHTNIYGEGDDVDVYFNVYFFDVQNPKDILDGSRPVLLEKGPYSYMEYFLKFDIAWSDDGDTVTFNTQKYYVFNPETSGPGLSEHDNLTLSYATSLGFQYLLEKIPVDANAFLDGLINATLAPIERALEEAAEDYRGPKKQLILDIEAGLEQLQADLERFIDEAPPGTGAMKILLCDAGPGGPSPFWVTQPQSAYFGWLNDPVMQAIADVVAAIDPAAYWTTSVPGAYINYTSVDDTRRRRTPDTVKTGKKNSKEINRYKYWGNRTDNWCCVAPGDSKQSADFVEGDMFPACSQFQRHWGPAQALAHGYVQPWASDYANRVAGTDGQIYGNYVDSDALQIYSYDIYRSAYFNLIDPTVLNWHNIQLRRYSYNAADNYNVETRPTQWQWNQYGMNGLTNMTFLTVPAYGSMPHFLYGDVRLLEAVEGVTPGVPSQHETQLDVEPHTGIMPQAFKRIQMNYWVEETVLPNMSVSAVQNAHELCNLLSLFPSNSSNFTNFTCDEFNALFTCMAAPSHWDIAGGGVYLPYAWLDENTVFPQRYATDIQEGILDTQQLAADVRTWGLVTGGGWALLAPYLILNNNHQFPAELTNIHSYMDIFIGIFFALCFGFLYSQKVSRDEHLRALKADVREDVCTTSPLLPAAPAPAGDRI
jgi:hypothetical protein